MKVALRGVIIGCMFLISLILSCEKVYACEIIYHADPDKGYGTGGPISVLEDSDFNTENPNPYRRVVRLKINGPVDLNSVTIRPCACKHIRIEKIIYTMDGAPSSQPYISRLVTTNGLFEEYVGA